MVSILLLDQKAKKKDSPILSASTNPIIDLCESNPNGQSSGADFGG